MLTHGILLLRNFQSRGYLDNWCRKGKIQKINIISRIFLKNKQSLHILQAASLPNFPELLASSSGSPRSLAKNAWGSAATSSAFKFSLSGQHSDASLRTLALRQWLTHILLDSLGLRCLVEFGSFILTASTILNTSVSFKFFRIEKFGCRSEGGHINILLRNPLSWRPNWKLLSQCPFIASLRTT